MYKLSIYVCIYIYILNVHSTHIACKQTFILNAMNRFPALNLWIVITFYKFQPYVDYQKIVTITTLGQSLSDDISSSSTTES